MVHREIVIAAHAALEHADAGYTTCCRVGRRIGPTIRGMNRTPGDRAACRTLGDGRVCEVNGVGRALPVLRDAYLAADATDHSAFVSALISHAVVFREFRPETAALVGRRLDYREAAELSDDDRGAVRSAIAESLGSPSARKAPSDAELVDMLLSSGLSSDPASDEGPAGLLRALFDAVEGWGARLHHAVRGVDPLVIAEAVGETAREALDDLRRELDLVRQQPLFFVVADLPVSKVRELLFARPHEIEGLIVDRILPDHDLLAQVTASVEKAPVLGEPQREDLRRGLDGLRTSDPYACRHLLGGLEGALWLTASAHGIIDGDRRLVHSKRPRHMQVRGVSGLLRKDGGLPVGTDLAIFLLGAVFDDRGNDIRHGRATSGHRTASAWAFVGLLGWLDKFAGTSFMADVTTRMALAPT